MIWGIGYEYGDDLLGSSGVCDLYFKGNKILAAKGGGWKVQCSNQQCSQKFSRLVAKIFKWKYSSGDYFLNYFVKNLTNWRKFVKYREICPRIPPPPLATWSGSKPLHPVYRHRLWTVLELIWKLTEEFFSWPRVEH